MKYSSKHLFESQKLVDLQLFFTVDLSILSLSSSIVKLSSELLLRGLAWRDRPELIFIAMPDLTRLAPEILIARPLLNY